MWAVPVGMTVNVFSCGAGAGCRVCGKIRPFGQGLGSKPMPVGPCGRVYKSGSWASLGLSVGVDMGVTLVTMALGAWAYAKSAPPYKARRVGFGLCSGRAGRVGDSGGGVPLRKEPASRRYGLSLSAIFLTTMVSLWLAQEKNFQASAIGPMLGSTAVSMYALIGTYDCLTGESGWVRRWLGWARVCWSPCLLGGGSPQAGVSGGQKLFCARLWCRMHQWR